MEKQTSFIKIFKKPLALCVVGLCLSIFLLIMGYYFLKLEIGGGYCYVLFVVGGVSLFATAGGIRTLWQRYNEMKNNLPIIESGYVKIKEELKEIGFNTDEHYSSFGYNWIEYRNVFGAKDNLHVEIDKKKKLIACYMLLPYEKMIKSFEQITSVEISTTQDIKKGKTFYTAICVVIKFDGNDLFLLNVTDNIGCYFGDETYQKAMEDGEKLKRIILSLKENA